MSNRIGEEIHRRDTESTENLLINLSALCVSAVNSLSRVKDSINKQPYFLLTSTEMI